MRISDWSSDVCSSDLFLIVPVIIKYSLKKNLLDIPGRRKIHKKVTPSMGGIAIFGAFFISCLIWIELSSWNQIKWILVRSEERRVGKERVSTGKSWWSR